MAMVNAMARCLLLASWACGGVPSFAGDEASLLQVTTNVELLTNMSQLSQAQAEQLAGPKKGAAGGKEHWRNQRTNHSWRSSGLPKLQGDRIAVHVPSADVDMVGLKNEDGTATFYGVPYAAPPVHDRRWRSPQPVVRPPSGVIVATRPRANCIQPEFPQKMLAHPEWGSAGAWPSLASGPTSDGRPNEDCLYLNIFAPDADFSNSAGSQKRPVLIWIPGGMNFFGGANDEHLDGRTLSKVANAIIVTFSYRLGVLGYAWHSSIEDRNEDFDTPILAHQDQQAVMKWVQDHISAFGGDPTRVTVGGESSGALDVMVHLLNPKSNHLFHRAVMSSPGELLGPNSIANLTWQLDPSHRWDNNRARRWQEAWEDAFAKAVTRQGSQCNKGSKSDIKVDIDCLFQLPAESLDPFADYALWIPDFPMPPSWMLNEVPAPNIPVMIGMNGGDGSFVNLVNERLHWLRTDAKLQDFERWASESFGVVGRHLASAYNDSERMLTEGRFTQSPGSERFNAGYRLGTAALLDWGYTCPAFEAASIFQGEGMDTYIYKFDRAPHDQFLLCDDVNCDGTEKPEDFLIAGSCHGCDVPFWFLNGNRLSEDEMKVSKMMVSYLAGFMRTGNPNAGQAESQQPVWPRVVASADLATRSSTWLHTWKPPAPDVAGIMLFGAEGSPYAEPLNINLEKHSHCQQWSTIALHDRTREQELQSAYVMLVVLLVVVVVLAIAAPHIRDSYRRWREEAAQKSLGGKPESVMVGPLEEFPINSCVATLFRDRAASQPDTIALITGEEGSQEEPRSTITFGVLQERVAAIGRAVRAAGAGENCIVPVIMERGVRLVAGIMGVLDAGAAWAAVDPAAPEERQSGLMAQMKATVVVIQAGLKAPSAPAVTPVFVDSWGNVVGPVSDREPVEDSCDVPVAERLAMVVFTSGSTGEPKGVLYNNRMLMHGSWFYGQLAKLEPGQRALLKSPHIWAVIEYELFPPLIYGATTFVARPNGQKQPGYLAQCLAKERLDSLMITPRVLEPILDEIENKSLASSMVCRNCICIGEALRSETALRWVHTMRHMNSQIHNVYGPSETSCTVWSYPPGNCQSSGFVMAGKPQPHAFVHLLRKEVDSNGKITWIRVPEGQEGEICIGGIKSSGYMNKPEETSAKFLEVPGIEGQIYCTGDLGKLVNGELQVLGRIDRQLNVNGVRIEPGEIEASLKKVAKEACVVAAGDPEKLVAICVAKDGQQGDTRAAQQACGQKLPEYMVPKVLEWLPMLPSLPNGKVDIKKCKAMAAAIVEKLAEEEGEIVDSLGIRRNMSKTKMLWQSATWACYGYWSLGVVVDHWMGCNPKSWTCETVAYLLPNWGELALRSLGNVQDMCGFLVLGALHDAGDDPKQGAKLGIRELVVWILHILTYSFIPVIGWLTPWQGPYPNIQESNIHRWYLWMYVLARLILAAFMKLNVPAILQVVIVAFCAYIAPPSGILDVCSITTPDQYLHKMGFVLFPSYCQDTHHNVGASAVRDLSRGNGCSCAITGQPELAYMAYYIAAFHLAPYLKQLPKCSMAVVTGGILLSGLTILNDLDPVFTSKYAVVPEFLVILLAMVAVHYIAEARGWEAPAVLLLGTCVFSQITVSQYYYAMDSLERGKFDFNTPLELLLCTVQPLLFIMAALKLVVAAPDGQKMSWGMSIVKLAGSSALGSYLFHYYFTPTAVLLVHHGAYAVSQAAWLGPLRGLVQFSWVMLVPICFVLMAGPAFQFLLTYPVRVMASYAQAPPKK
nr:nonribosomal peptide synthetase 3963 [Ostreopsis cf. ovata]